MTAHDIIKIAMGDQYEDIENDTDAAQHSLDVLNILLMECFGAEQNSREWKGQELLTEVPQVTSDTDEIPYNDILLRLALPYGIEWKFAEQNLNQYQADQYHQLYLDAKKIAGGGVWI